MTSDGSWETQSPLGVYVHIPFCAHRCHYCDFNTYESLDELHLPYARSLITSIRDWETTWSRAPWGEHKRPAGPAGTLFFGGGTPTLLPPAVLGEIVAAVGDHVGITADAEITVEANPETLDETVLEGLLEAGFNRLSIGVQSTSAGVLAALGRRHSAARALEAIDSARHSGFRSINADLIYGSVGESEDDWRASLKDVVAARPDHVSAYALTVEPGTPLGRSVASGRMPDVDPDVQAERWEIASGWLRDAGYERYEVSNWARPGHACRHNLLYWSGGDYLAFGSGAHGHSDGLRYWLRRLPRDLIASVAAGDPGVDGWERLDETERGREALMLGLRLASGIDTDAFIRRFGRRYLDAARPGLSEMQRLGLLICTGKRISVAGGATLVVDDLLGRLP